MHLNSKDKKKLGHAKGNDKKYIGILLQSLYSGEAITDTRTNVYLESNLN